MKQTHLTFYLLDRFQNRTLSQFLLGYFADDIEDDVEIRVHIDLFANEAEEKAAEKQLMKQIKAMPEVSEVIYSSKEEELQILIDNYGEELSLYEQGNPLNSVLYVKAKDPQQTAAVAKHIEKLDSVYKVKYGEGKVEKLFNILSVRRKS